MKFARPQVETLGCRLNEYESEAMSEVAAAQGLSNAIIVNTCAVTAEATRKSRQAVRRAARQNPGAKLVVTGCAAQIDPASFAALDGVDALIGNGTKLAPDIWRELSDRKAEDGPQMLIDDIMSAKHPSNHLISSFGKRARAHVQVQNGCDHRCTFCIIPYGRGNSRSVPMKEVVSQVGKLAGHGYREVVLSGVDLTCWGKDLPGESRLGNLIACVLDHVPELERLRLSSIDVVEIDAKLMELIESEQRLMPHLHLSLQAGNNTILKRMKRRHLREDAIRICTEIRQARPGIAFGADLIAGFPTETDAMFADTLDLVRECGLTWLHVFPYSSRNGTPAARMPQVGPAEIRKRAAMLRELAAQCVHQHLKDWVGRTGKVLLEASHIGRTEQFAEVMLTEDPAAGGICTAEFIGIEGKRLIGRPVALEAEFVGGHGARSAESRR